MDTKRLSTLAGLVFAVLMLVVLVLSGSTPGAAASAAKITSYYLAHHDQQVILSFVLAFDVLFLVVFAAAIDRALVAGHEGDRPLGRVVFLAGTAIGAASFLAAAAIHFALSEGVFYHVSPAAAQALNALDENDWLMFTGGLGVMLIGAAAWLIPRPIARPWAGWTALVIGIASFTPVAFLAFLAGGVWIAALSIRLAWQGPRASAGVASGRPAPAAARG